MHRLLEQIATSERQRIEQRREDRLGHRAVVRIVLARVRVVRLVVLEDAVHGFALALEHVVRLLLVVARHLSLYLRDQTADEAVSTHKLILRGLLVMAI